MSGHKYKLASIILGLLLLPTQADASILSWIKEFYSTALGAPSVIYPIQGGTGTSTTPTTNTVLIGNSNGKYDTKVLSAGSNISFVKTGTTFTINGSGGSPFTFETRFSPKTAATTSPVHIGGILSASSTVFLSDTLTAEHILAQTDNTYDIGNNTTGSFRTGYFDTSVVSPLLTLFSNANIAGSSGTITYTAAVNQFSNGVVIPANNDGASLGNTTFKWSDLFLANGAVINFNSADVTITHGSNQLLIAGGDLYLTNQKLSFGINTIYNDMIMTFELGNIKYGIGLASATQRYYVSNASGDTAIHSFGTISSTDGTTYAERLQVSSTALRLASGLTYDLGTTGARISAASGVLTLAGIGNTNNENLLLNFEGVANTVGWSSGTGVTNMTLGSIGLSGTAVYDFGGATSFEIPNGTAPALSAVGQLAYDSTDRQLLVATSTSSDNEAAGVIPIIVKLFEGTASSSTVTTGDYLFLPPQRDGFIVEEIHCIVDGGTSWVINLSNSAGTTDSDSVTCDADGASDTAMSTNYLYPSGSFNRIEFGTITGAVDYVTFSIYGTFIRE